MRNLPKPLTPDEWRAVRSRVQTLADAFNYDEPVTLVYSKRNGQTSSSTGKVDGFVGKAGFDTFSVNIVDRSKGIRTINLSRVHVITM
jgi:hypothetical protein